LLLLTAFGQSVVRKEKNPEPENQFVDESLFMAGSEGKMRLTQTRKKAGGRQRKGMKMRGAGRRGEMVMVEEGMEEPRSSRISKRAEGAWHLGR